jgi:hypothetical protein
MRTILAWSFAVLLFSSGSAQADLIFQFSHDNNGNTNYDPGTSYLFNTTKPPSTYTALASGYSFADQTLSGTGTAEGLYIRNNGPGQMGLGLDNSDPDKQIHYNELVQLNLQAVRAALGNNVIMTIDSVETGQGYRLFSSGSAGVAGTDFHDFLSTQTGQVVQSYQLTLTEDYLGLSAIYDGVTQGDVLLNSVTFTAVLVPEPPAIALALVGIGGLTVAWRFRRRQTSSGLNSLEA